VVSCSSDAPVEVSLEADGRYCLAFPAGGIVAVTDGALRGELPLRAARVWIRE
jgi:energy-converting hydrogenase Eha subunit B